MSQNHNFHRLQANFKRQSSNSTISVDNGNFVGVGKGLSFDGRKKVIFNMFEMIAFFKRELMSEICTIVRADQFIYNAYCVQVAVGLRNVLDAVAKLCHDAYHSTGKSEAVDYFDIYFHTFSFSEEEEKYLSPLIKKIGEITFDGKNFTDTAHILKHNIPWVGLLSMNSIVGYVDIFDDGSIGFVYDFLCKVFNIVETIIHRVQDLKERPSKI